MKRCSRCGSVHADDLTFCPADGTPLEPVEDAASPPDPVRPVAAASTPPATVVRTGLSPVAVGLLILVVLLAIAVGVLWGRSGAPASPDAAPQAAAPQTAPPAAPPGTTAPTAPDNNAYLVYADSPRDGFLAIRSDPSVDSGARIGQILHGVGAEVLDGNGPPDTIGGIRGRWIRVRAPSGTGWVFDGYTTTQDVGRNSGTVDEGRWARVNGPSDGALNLRTGPSNTTRVVTVMRRGEDVYVPFCRSDVVVSTSGYPGRWCRVRLERGAAHIGWAFDAFLDGVGT